MTILAVYAIIVVYVANSKVQACRPGELLEDICGPPLECNIAGEWPIPKDQFDINCKRCYITNDPHFINFLDVIFDWHGTCTYSIAQNRWFHDPEYILSGKFEDCVDYPGATCIGEMVYKVSAALTITFAPTGQHSGTSSFDLSINGAPKVVILDGLPRVIPNDLDVVLAWRLGDCLMIMANKGFTIEFCSNGWSMNIWVPTKIESKIYGLCGHVDDEDIGKLLTRQGDLLSNTKENVETFATSWETKKRPNGCFEGRVKEGSACTANETVLANYRTVCNESIQADLPSDLKRVAIDNCVFDRCVIMEAINRGGNITYPDPAEWLNQAVKSAKNQAKIIKNTINLADACEGSQGYRGKCFGTQEDLVDFSRCDSLLRDATGCEDGESCCVDCSRQTDLCNSKWENSKARNVYNSTNHCCNHERKLGELRPGSGCTCCIRCDYPDRKCKAANGKCITDDDPKHNKKFCAARNGTLHDDLCNGGCSCCIWDRK